MFTTPCLKKTRAYLCLLSCIALYPATARATGGIVSLTNEEIATQQQVSSAQQSSSAYVDQLIDDSIAEDSPLEPLSEVNEAKEDEGNLRSYVISTDLFHFYSNQGRKETRLSFDFNGSYQTLNYGDLRFEATARGRQEQGGGAVNENESGGHFVLKQSDFALGKDWALENTLGINQNFQSHLVSNSGYVNLSSHLFQGGMSRVYSPKTELRIMAGEKGELTETGSFAGSGSEVTGLGVSRYLHEDLIAGGQFWHIKPKSGNSVSADGSLLAEDEYSFFVHYGDEAKRRSVKLQTVSANNNRGIWLDGKFQVNRFDNQVSFYYLDDGLQWMGEELADDVYGASWRFSFSHPRFSTHSALSWQDKKDGWSASAQQGISYQLDRETRLGGNIGHSSAVSTDKERRQSRLRAYVTRHLGNGQRQRLQVGMTNVDEQASAGEEKRSNAYELDYAHQWLLQKSNDVGLQFAVRSNDAEDNDNYSVQTGLSWRKELEDGNHLGASLTVNQVVSDSSTDTNVSSRIYTQYRVDETWKLAANLEYKEAIDAEDSQIYAGLELSHWATKGRPVRAWHRRAGNIRGVVFFDENNDGIRQPLEKAAPDVTISLSGNNIPQNSDRNGEFEFTRIPSGTYKVGVVEDSIPLPWELTESSLQSVEVAVRQTEFVYLPLVRLSELD